MWQRVNKEKQRLQSSGALKFSQHTVDLMQEPLQQTLTLNMHIIHNIVKAWGLLYVLFKTQTTRFTSMAFLGPLLPVLFLYFLPSV